MSGEKPVVRLSLSTIWRKLYKQAASLETRERYYPAV